MSREGNYKHWLQKQTGDRRNRTDPTASAHKHTCLHPHVWTMAEKRMIHEWQRNEAVCLWSAASSLQNSRNGHEHVFPDLCCVWWTVYNVAISRGRTFQCTLVSAWSCGTALPLQGPGESRTIWFGEEARVFWLLSVSIWQANTARRSRAATSRLSPGSCLLEASAANCPRAWAAFVCHSRPERRHLRVRGSARGRSSRMTVRACGEAVMTSRGGSRLQRLVASNITSSTTRASFNCEHAAAELCCCHCGHSAWSLVWEAAVVPLFTVV